MASPDQTPDPDQAEPPVSKSEGDGNRRVRRRRTRIAKETMYAIELHRRQMRQRLLMGIGVIVLTAAAVGIMAWYPGSSHFRTRIDGMIAATTGAKVELVNARFSSFSGQAERIAMTWPDGNFLRGLDAEKLTARVSPQRHFGRLYGGDEIRVEKATLRLGYPGSGAEARIVEADGGESRISFERIGISDFDVEFGTPEDPGHANLLGTEVAFYPDGINGIPRALLYEGLLELPGWPQFHVNRGIIDFAPDGVRVTSLNFQDIPPEKKDELLAGDAEITGVFARDPEQPSILQLQLDSFQIQSLIGDEAGRFLIGRVDTAPGESAGSILVSRDGGVKVSADLVANPRSQLTFNHFPFLAFLARATDDRWFLNPIFDEAPSLTWSRSGSEMRFEDIHFVARDRMTIRGAMMIDGDGEIDGQIEVGLSPIVIDAAIARRLDGMFSPVRDELRWVRLQLGGTTRVPTDNFNSQFIEAPMPRIEMPQPMILAPEEVEIAVPPASPDPERAEPPTVLPLLDLDNE